jgi:hypothetical protein
MRVIPFALSLAALMSGDQASSATFNDLPGAPQLIYQNGVPQTDRNGRIQFGLTSSSFFPRCAYETLPGMLASLQHAGFNCFKPWNGLSLASVLAEAHGTVMQLIKEIFVAACNFSANPGCDPNSNASAQIVSLTSQIATAENDPNLLAWYIEDEPTACILPPSNCPERIANFENFKAAIKAVDSTHPVVDQDIGLPRASALPQWSRLNSAGDVAANDNYPFHTGNERTLEASVTEFSRLVALNHQQKPVWLTLQAFGLPAQNGLAWKLPTPGQLRAEVFAALVHGATGIVYFALDNWASRNAQVIGITATPLASYPNQHPGDAVATASDIASSETLWNATVSLNAELQRLQSVILSPTATLPYRVAIQGRAISATPIRTLLKMGNEGVYTLLVSNIDDMPLNVHFTLPVPPLDLHSIDAGGARNRIGSNSNSFADSIEGYGVRIFEFSIGSPRR